MIAQWLWEDKQLAWIAAFLAATGGFYASTWNQPETFAPFAWAGGLTLWFLALGRQKGSGHLWLLAGLGAALAHLTRADGLLLLGVGFLSLWPRRWDRATLSTRVWQGSLLLVGYLLLMGPWLWRNVRVFGRPLPTAGTQTLFLRTYDELFSFGRSFTSSDYFAWGLENIVGSKLMGLSVALQTFIAICGLIFLTPLIIAAWTVLWRNLETKGRILPLSWLYHAVVRGDEPLLYLSRFARRVVSFHDGNLGLAYGTGTGRSEAGDQMDRGKSTQLAAGGRLARICTGTGCPGSICDAGCRGLTGTERCHCRRNLPTDRFGSTSGCDRNGAQSTRILLFYRPVSLSLFPMKQYRK